jgi:hypothetical protein
MDRDRSADDESRLYSEAPAFRAFAEHAIKRGYEAVFDLNCPAGTDRTPGELWILAA